MDTQLVFRLIELVRKTGDRLILADPSSDSAVVVMDLAAYERLLNQASEQPANSRSETVSATEQPIPTPPRKDIVRSVAEVESIPVEPPPVARPIGQFQPQSQEFNQAGLERLTVSGTRANINREIGLQSTVKSVIESMVKSSPRDEARIQNQSAVQQPASLPTEPSVGQPDEPAEEERFYLEPIE